MKKQSKLRFSYKLVHAPEVQGRIDHAFDLIFSKIAHEGCGCGWTSVGEILAKRYSKDKEKYGE